jgi:hypothetical protein
MEKIDSSLEIAKESAPKSVAGHFEVINCWTIAKKIENNLFSKVWSGS